MNENDLKHLMERVATHVSGHPCKVRLQHPIVASAQGQTSKSFDGTAIMDIDPNLKLDVLFDVFTHELAHLCLDYEEMQASDYHRKEEGSEWRSQAQRGKNRLLPRELRADAKAAHISAYGRKHAPDFVNWGDPSPIIPQLRALLEYPT
jgi:hypothetical protein